MQLSSKARKVVASGLAASTMLWAAGMAAVPQIASAAVHSNGCLVLSGGTVWLITNGTRRGFTSAEVFMSHGYNFLQVVNATAEDVALPVGPIMVYADGTLVKGPNDPLVYLVVNGQKRGFVSGSVFTNLGYMFANVKQAPVNTFSDLPTGANIDANTSGASLPKSGPAPQTVACTTGSGSTTTLEGEGSVEDFSVGSPEDSTISEGQDDVELVSFDVQLSDDGSLALNRFDLYMGQDNAVTASNKPWDYFTDATLMVDGKKISTMDVDSSSDWTEYDTGTLATTSQEYRLRFTNLDAVLPSGETTAVSVAFSTHSNLDSADEDAVWQFGTETDSFRFEDATGFIFTDGEDLASSFSLDTADTAALKISAGDDDPDAQVIEVDRTSDTNGVILGQFDIEETEGVDVNISEMTVTLATSDTITDVVKTLYLYNGSTKVGQETVTGTTVTFDPIDLDVDGDDTVTLTVKADLDDTNDNARYQNGDTLSVSAVNLTEYTDAMDNDEGDFTETGSYASETHGLFSEGIHVDNFDWSKVVNTSDTVGVNETVEFTMEFDVTAFGDDVWVDQTCVVGTTGTDVDATEVSLDGDADGSSTTCTDYDSTGDAGTDGFEVKEGQTEHFTVTVLGDGGEAGVAGSSVTFKARINGIGYNLTDDAAGDTVYNFNIDDFHTSAVTIYDR